MRIFYKNNQMRIRQYSKYKNKKPIYNDYRIKNEFHRVLFVTL